MKRVTLFLGLLMIAFCWQVQAQTQSKSFYMAGKKINLSTGTPTLSVYSTVITNSFINNPEGCAPYGAFTDGTGNAVVSVIGRRVCNSAGNVVGLLSAGYNVSYFPTGEVSIVPVPGSSCKYYIIHTFTSTTAPEDLYCPNISQCCPITAVQHLWYSTYDASGNSGNGSLSVGTPLINCETNYTSSLTMAVSHLKSNNMRYLYVTRPYPGIKILKYEISATAITLNTTYNITISGTPETQLSPESDLSFDDSKLIFNNGYGNLYWAHLNPVNGNLLSTAGNLGNGLTKMTLTGGNLSGVEFSPDGTKAFVGVQGVGIRQINVATAASLGYVTNSIDYSRSQLEIGYDPNSNYKLYAVSNSGTELGSIANPNGTGLSLTASVLSGINAHHGGYFNIIKLLPDQLDGETYSNLAITGILATCNQTTLTATAGFDNYLWSNGATTQSITATSSGTYTVQAWDNGNCHSAASTTVTIYPNPPIHLDPIYYVCNGQFPTLCAPNSPFYKIDFKWYYTAPGTQTSVLVGSNPCFTPTAYGHYSIVVTNAYGCTQNVSFQVLPGTGPALNLPDIFYCGKNPAQFDIHANGGNNAVFYSWTYNGVPALGYVGPLMDNKGDGIYCVTVRYKDGCSSTDCFEVKECCEPVTDFTYSWSSASHLGTLTLQNNPNNTSNYLNETWILYKYCGSSTDLSNVNWIQVGLPITRTSNFNAPVIFTHLNKNCKYKIVHRVNSPCFDKTYVSTVYFIPLIVEIFGNPLKNGEPLNIEMVSQSERASVEINDVMTGKLVYTGSLEHGAPLKIDYSTFENGGRAGMRDYTIRISNGSETLTEKLIVD